VQFEWQLQAACGYAELGMTRESLAELDAIDIEAGALIDGAVKDAKAAAPPVEADLYSDVYIQY